MDNWSIKKHQAKAITGLKLPYWTCRKSNLTPCWLDTPLLCRSSMSLLDSSVRMLLNNLKGKRNMKEKAVSEELSRRKENAIGGEECLQLHSFSHFNFSLQDWLMVAPEWVGPGSQGLRWPLSIDKPREMSAESSWGSPGCQALWKLLPIQPKFQLNSRHREGERQQ